MMDINRLCPGCMRELETALQMAGASNTETEDAAEVGRGQKGMKIRNGTVQKAGKCPYCGFDTAIYRQNSRCLPINTILAGKYLVGAVLGEGGFGITYMGYDLNMETRIAIKEYFPVELVSRDTTSMTGDRVISLSGDKSVTYKQGLKKYVAEAQNVSHFSETPGVVSVKDFFYENETAYIVMEYIEGVSLKDYLKERGGRLSEEEALAIMKPVLEALVKVHEAGIIHRDISPDNIMLAFEDGRRDSIALKYRTTESDRTVATDNSVALNADAVREEECNCRIVSVKLIDFGAARMTAKNDQKSLTIILKHGYAPEEQYRTHGEQGSWTDVYAVCAVLYRMLTGQTPVPAMDRLFQDDLKSFDDLNAKVSKPTQSAILKGLAVKKEDRIQTMTELIQALYEGKAIRPKMRRTPALVIGISAACLLTAAIIVGVLFSMPYRRNQNPESVSEKTVGESDSSMHKTQGDGSLDSHTEALTTETGTEAVVEFETEELGEAIAFPDPQSSISIRESDHVLIRMPGGTVEARGGNEHGQCMVAEWSDVVAVSAGYWYSLGLRSDGRVLAAGNNEIGQCDVETWENVVQIAAGVACSYGLTADGRVLACGYNGDGHLDEVMEWEDIVAIVVGETDEIIGVDAAGTVHYAGSRRGRPAITGWTGVKKLCYGYETSANLIGIREDGTVVREELEAMPSWAVEIMGEDNPCYKELGGWSGIQQLFCSYSPVLGVREDGTVICAPNGGGGQGTWEERLAEWTDMEAVVAVAKEPFSRIIGLQKDGNILEYCVENGNATLEMIKEKKLDWVHIISAIGIDGLLARSTDGKFMKYGGSPLDYIESFSGETGIPVSQIQDVLEENVILTRDGRLFAEMYLPANDSYYWYWNEIGQGAKQAVELWGGSYPDEVSGKEYNTYCFVLLKEDGHVQVEILGDDITDSGVPIKDYIEPLKEADGWEDVVQIEGNSMYCKLYGLHRDGTVSAIDTGFQVASVSGIKKISEMNGDVLGIKEDGTVEVIAASKYAVMFGRTQVSAWTDIQDISMGESHVVGLREDGTVVAAGSNHEGQCDVEDWTDIVYLITGRNCTIGLTSDGQLKMAGNLY